MRRIAAVEAGVSAAQQGVGAIRLAFKEVWLSPAA